MLKLKGLEFQECFIQAVIFDNEELEIRTLHLNNLIEAKKASGRNEDLDDLENLSRLWFFIKV